LRRKVMSFTLIVRVFCSFCEVLVYSQDLIQKNTAEDRRIARAFDLGVDDRRSSCL